MSAPPFPPWAPLPAHRSPYGLGTPLDGASTAAVRPYLVAHEQQQWRQQGDTTPAWPGTGLYPAAGIEAA
ncbi:hypothetical protein RFN58_23150 [Streptomyces iakyrus]|uniref:hypothetical protein n=1 Tax=Streptomyces iakyrus TaxID=68219 RepID=UPI002E31C318|nr:hypothetical protein [Streptomyces iakyrus]